MKLKLPTRRELVPMLFTLPTVVLMMTIMIGPLIYAIYLSFFNKRLLVTAPAEFIGFQNYANVLTSNHFQATIVNTLLYIILSVLGAFIIGLLAALVLNKEFRGVNVARSLMLLPFLTPVVVVAITWRWMFNDSYGVINDLLVRTGLLQHGINWLGETTTALYAIIFSNIWRMFPFHCIMILAALHAVPKSLHEAADIDGVSGLQKFIFITFPLILPTCLLSITITTLLALNDFPMVWIMTQGGPGHATEIFSTFVFKQGLRFYQLGSASAAGVVALIIIGGGCLFLVRLIQASSRKAGHST